MMATGKSIIFIIVVAVMACSKGGVSYDPEMETLVESAGPGKLKESRDAYAYCAERLKLDQVIPKSLFLGSCSALEIMVIQNVIETGDPWKIKDHFDQTQTIHPDFNKWRPFYVKMSEPYVDKFCRQNIKKKDCQNILK